MSSQLQYLTQLQQSLASVALERTIDTTLQAKLATEEGVTVSECGHRRPAAGRGHRRRAAPYLDDRSDAGQRPRDGQARRQGEGRRQGQGRSGAQAADVRNGLGEGRRVRLGFRDSCPGRGPQLASQGQRLRRGVHDRGFRRAAQHADRGHRGHRRRVSGSGGPRKSPTRRWTTPSSSGSRTPGSRPKTIEPWSGPISSGRASTPRSSPTSRSRPSSATWSRSS